MLKFIPLDLCIHQGPLLKLNKEHLLWISQKESEIYNINLESEIGIKIEFYVEECVKEFSNIYPPDGIYYILFIKNKPIGMGALKKISAGIGEIKRMYIRPKHRGKGYGKSLLNKLLTMAKEYNFTVIRLDTAIYMRAAQKIYRAAGFCEREKYPETEVPKAMQSHWLYFERSL